MPLVLHLPQDAEAMLADRARRAGQELSQFVLGLLLQSLSQMDTLRDADGDLDGEPFALEKAVTRLRGRTPEETARNRARILAGARPPAPLPRGKTLTEVVVGKWPGDETDEEIAALLAEMS